MAHVLQIIRGSNTLDLNASGIQLLDFSPKVPTDLSENARVTEVIKVEIKKSTVALLQAAINQFNMEMSYARWKTQTRSGNRVFLSWQPDEAAAAYRSEIFDGSLSYTAEVFDAEWVEKSLDVTLTIVRRFFWEGPLTNLSLTNGNGTSSTGLAVYNHNDSTSGHDNWVQVPDGLIGDLPAPIYLYVENSYATGSMKNLFYSVNYTGTAASFTNCIEAESGTGGTTTVDAACSNGNRKDISWTATTETQVWSYQFSSSELGYALGQFFQPLLRMAGTLHAYTNLWLRWRLKWNSQIIWNGGWVLSPASTPLQELGTFQLPPSLMDSYSLPIDLELLARRNTAGTHSFSFDYIGLMPMNEYRRLKVRSSSFALNQYGLMIDDQPEMDLYTRHGTTYHSPSHVGTGQARLLPGSIVGLQRVYFHHTDAANTAAVDRTINVTMKYRPRRISL